MVENMAQIWASLGIGRIFGPYGNGQLYTVNNRSLMALEKAGVNPTKIENVTGDVKFEKQITERLGEMAKDGIEDCDNFIPTIRPRRKD